MKKKEWETAYVEKATTHKSLSGRPVTEVEIGLLPKLSWKMLFYKMEENKYAWKKGSCALFLNIFKMYQYLPIARSK